MSSAAMRDFVDRLLGRGQAAVTVPPLDGALKPNHLLEEATARLAVPAPDNIVDCQGQLLFSSGARVHGSDGGALFETPGAVTAMAASPTGLLAVANAADGVSIRGPGAAIRPISAPEAAAFTCTTAMAFADERTLLVCVGSAQRRIDRWTQDLLEGGRSGSVWRVDLAGGQARCLIDGLAFASGVAPLADGACIVSESWRQRLIRVSGDGQVLGQVLEDLPGYPGRIAPSARGGYWLCVFAPRSQLIEFVLREPAYRRAMMKEVAPELWIAPALRSGDSPLEPMQGGALKQMGLLKPWAPTRSYGLLVELDADFVALRSMHSRAGGKRHGITSAIEHAGALWLTSKGGDAIVTLDIAARE